MTTIRARRAIGVALAALVIAGCSGDGDGGQPDATAPATDAAAERSSEAGSAASTGTAADDGASEAAGASGTAPDTYVVVEGDTLTAIADRFGTTIDAIVEANDIADPDVIDVGQELTIPQ